MSARHVALILGVSVVRCFVSLTARGDGFVSLDLLIPVLFSSPCSSAYVLKAKARDQGRASERFLASPFGLMSPWLILLARLGARAQASDSGAIVNPHSQKCLDMDADGKYQDGTKVQLWTCTGGDSQNWEIDGSEIKSLAHPGKCLDMDKGGTKVEKGTKVRLWTCHGGDAQKWKIDGSQIKSAAHTDQCLNIDTGGNYPVVIITCIHYLGPPGPSPSQILGTSSRFSEDFLGRERDP